MKVLLAVMLLCSAAYAQTTIDKRKAVEFNGGTVTPQQLLRTTARRPMTIHLRPETHRRLLNGTHTTVHLQELRDAIRFRLGYDFPLRECRPDETVDTLTGFIRPTSDHHCRDLIVGR